MATAGSFQPNGYSNHFLGEENLSFLKNPTNEPGNPWPGIVIPDERIFTNSNKLGKTDQNGTYSSRGIGGLVREETALMNQHSAKHRNIKNNTNTAVGTVYLFTPSIDRLHLSHYEKVLLLEHMRPSDVAEQAVEELEESASLPCNNSLNYYPDILFDKQDTVHLLSPDYPAVMPKNAFCGWFLWVSILV